MEKYIGTRGQDQLRSHAQKFLKKLEKNPDIEGNDLKDLLSVNLRALNN